MKPETKRVSPDLDLKTYATIVRVAAEQSRAKNNLIALILKEWAEQNK